MPELPEVETVLRSLLPHLPGRTIVQARFSSRLVLREDPARAARALRGRTVLALRRHAKFLLFELSGGMTLSVHLGMTGKLLWNAEPGPYARAVFELDQGRLVYDDVRQFGRIELDCRRAEKLGPDALGLAAERFAELLAARRGRIKPLLLNQRFVGGMGNIYTDEALFRARIHPLAAAERLKRARVQRLHEAMQQILAEAVATGGSSISDYVNADGDAGSFQINHQVYGREGEPCARCRARIRRIVVAGRGTHFCPRCQRLPKA